MYTKKLPFQNTFEKYNRPVKYKKKSRTPKTYKNDTRQYQEKTRTPQKKPERPWAISNAQHPGPRPPAPWAPWFASVARIDAIHAETRFPL
jgi:hypothetical protein